MQVVLVILFFCCSFLCLYAQKNKKLAEDLCMQFILVDGHVDLPYRLKVQNFRLEKSFIGIPVSSKTGDFDYKRAKKGGLDAPFMSIYIPSNLSGKEAQLLADSLIYMVRYIADQKPKYFGLAKTPGEIFNLATKGKLALPMGMENGSPILQISDVAAYRRKGISYITLTHAKDNHISDSSYDSTGTWQGLSPYGEEVVKAMAKEGIMIDVSHISDKAFYDVLAISPVPVIASHSSARRFTPGFERNMSDDMLRKLKQNNGVIMVNFGSTFLDKEVADYRKSLEPELKKYLSESKLSPNSEEAGTLTAKFFDDKKLAFSNVQKVADHIDHIVKIAGIDHVGLGSDYDGVGNSLPVGLKDVSDYPKLIEELLNRDYSKADIQKICSLNIFRVWNKVLEYAEKN